MKKLYQLISRVLNEDVALISDDSSPDTLNNWDSFNGLLMVDELEKEFAVSFTMDEIMDVKTVRDIKRHLKNHGINLDEETS